MSESVDSLAALKRSIAALGGGDRGRDMACVATGHPGMDRALGGGMARGRMHELFGSEPGCIGSVCGFAAMLARQIGGGIVWLREEEVQRRNGGLHMPGLRDIGLDPAMLVLGLLPSAQAVLRAAADVARCGDVGVAVVELWRNPQVLDLTASRRLTLAAETSGTTVLMIRIAAQPLASAAHSRWDVRAAPSSPMEANAPGFPALEVELLRQRGRPAGGVWHVEWDREQAVFHDLHDRNGARSTPHAGAVVPVSVSRPAGANTIFPLCRAG